MTAYVAVVYRLSTEFIWVPVSLTRFGEPYDPTGSPVWLAFTETPADEPAVWNPGGWETVDGTPSVTCLIGPANSGVNLPVGEHLIWLKIQVDPEVLVFFRGYVRIT